MKLVSHKKKEINNVVLSDMFFFKMNSFLVFCAFIFTFYVFIFTFSY